MNHQVKTVNGITIEPVYQWEWSGEYSAGTERHEEVIWHFTDDECRRLERIASDYRALTPSLPHALPPAPDQSEADAIRRREADEAYRAECEAKQEIIEKHRAVELAIEDRRKMLAELYEVQ